MFIKILLAGIALALTTSIAAAYCSEPSTPFCASRYGPFDDEYDFDRCKREMESYRNDVEDFLSCTRQEIDALNQKANEATDEYNEAVESFNRRARG